MTPKQRMGAMHGTEPKEDGLWSRVAEERRLWAGPHSKSLVSGARNAWVCFLITTL